MAVAKCLRLLKNSNEARIFKAQHNCWAFFMRLIDVKMKVSVTNSSQLFFVFFIFNRKFFLV